MKKQNQLSGVTLLEVLLVLAIAAMIIMMSVRYYQTSATSTQVNSIMQQVHTITSLADGIAQGVGNYSTISTSTLQPLMPNQAMKTSWGGIIELKTAGDYLYIVTFTSVSDAVCQQAKSKLSKNVYFTGAKCQSGSLIYTYDAGIR